MFTIGEYEAKIHRFYGVMVEHRDIADIRVSPDSWTLKEMVAHLIDSASNNHQRIIRMQIDKRINFPAYEAEEWKDVTKIKEYDFLDLADLWKGYNLYILFLIKHISIDDLSNIWEVDGEELTLQFIVDDYFGRHLDWHIALYAERIGELVVISTVNND